MLNGYRVSIWGDENSLEIMVMVDNIVNVINATQLYTKWLKKNPQLLMSYTFYHNNILLKFTTFSSF